MTGHSLKSNSSPIISHNSSHSHLTELISQSHLSHTTHLTHTHTTPLIQSPATQKRPVPRGYQTHAGNAQRVKVLRLPRKNSARCTKCCACRAKAAGPPRRPNARRQLPESQSAAPATQKYREIHRVLRLPRKCARSLRRPNAHRQVPDSKVLRLPRNSSATCTECCAREDVC